MFHKLIAYMGMVSMKNLHNTRGPSYSSVLLTPKLRADPRVADYTID
jgi:hypothetical protein